MDEIIKKINQINRKIEKLTDERSALWRIFKEKNIKIPENVFAKATWMWNGRKQEGVVWVVSNVVLNTGTHYEVLPSLLKCEPIAEKDDDGTCKHYYNDYWEKKKKFVKYDRLISIEPFDAPMQKCGKCLFLGSRIDENGNLRVGCDINLGRKTNGGDADACDRFKWWNWERSLGCTHIEYIVKKYKEQNNLEE